MTNPGNDSATAATAPASADAPPALRCLGGAPAPEGTADDLQQLALVPDAIRPALWELLSMVLPEELPAGFDSLLDRFAAEHGLPQARLVRVLRACRLLLREAARRNLAAPAFGDDLTALGVAPTSDVRAFVLARYGDVMSVLRHEVRYGSLTDHGKLLTRVDWRVDVVKHAHRGVEIEEPVALVTLHLLEGDRRERVTFQALPDLLGELQNMCRQVLG